MICLVPGLLREKLSQIERTVQIFVILTRGPGHNLLETRKAIPPPKFNEI